MSIHSLAWLLSTTHLATLDAIRPHIDSHRVVRAVRTFGIVVFVVFLSYALVLRALIAMLGKDLLVPVQCVFEIGIGKIAKGSNWTGTFNVFWQSSWIITLALVLLGYLIRIQDFYARPRDPLYAISWLAWTLT